MDTEVDITNTKQPEDLDATLPYESGDELGHVLVYEEPPSQFSQTFKDMIRAEMRQFIEDNAAEIGELVNNAYRKMKQQMNRPKLEIVPENVLRDITGQINIV